VPTGPRGEKRPADAVARAVMVARIATGEIVEPTKREAKAGAAGAEARAKSLTPEKRSDIARQAAAIRWKSHGSD